MRITLTAVMAVLGLSTILAQASDWSEHDRDMNIKRRATVTEEEYDSL